MGSRWSRFALKLAGSNPLRCLATEERVLYDAWQAVMHAPDSVTSFELREYDTKTKTMGFTIVLISLQNVLIYLTNLWTLERNTLTFLARIG